MNLPKLGDFKRWKITEIEKLNVFYDILEDDHDGIFQNLEKIEIKSSKNGRFYNIDFLKNKNGKQ